MENQREITIAADFVINVIGSCYDVIHIKGAFKVIEAFTQQYTEETALINYLVEKMNMKQEQIEKTQPKL